MIKAVLFDLDGTFADTAPDLAHAINIMRASRGLPPLPADATRPVTSHGARGLLGVGFGMTPDHADYAAMREEFLGLYEANLCRETRLFPGMEKLLEGIEARALTWGIVTNKAERFAKPLMHLLKIRERCGCIVGGDTTSRMKPHPEPLFAACRLIGAEPRFCAYVGDDRRDVEAARAAGMRSIAVRYGYLNGGAPDAWGADAVVDCPEDVLKHI
ncbi:MAG TPA: phosphoglycolate phosphatase [Burkholderiales bacterium]|jgi:2-phosphoglycolate phosphatase